MDDDSREFLFRRRDEIAQMIEFYKARIAKEPEDSAVWERLSVKLEESQDELMLLMARLSPFYRLDD